MKKLLPLLLLVGIIQPSTAQFSVQPNQYRFRYNIPADRISVIEVDTIKKDTTFILPAKTVRERKVEIKNGNDSYTAFIRDTVKTDEEVKQSKETYVKKVVPFISDSLIKAEEDRRSKKKWFKRKGALYEEVVWGMIKQMKDTLFINPWLAEDRDITKTHFYKLTNRGAPLKVWFSTTEIGAMTIPFKYRFSYKKEKEVPSEFVPDFNVGVYVSRTWGKQTFYYWKNQEDRSPKTGFVHSSGVFGGISTTKLDSANTSLSTEYVKGTKTIAMFSVGPGYTLKIAGVSAGVFVGVDLPLGSTGRKWNYRNRPWIGFGIGYNLPLLSGIKQ